MAIPLRAVLLLLAAACATALTTPADAAQTQGARIDICHGSGCKLKTRYTVTPAGQSRFAQIMATGRASPAAERKAIGRAEMFYEEQAAMAIGARDNAGASITQIPRIGQMDCIDESMNTRSLLVYLARNGWLRHHRVEPNVTRGFFADGRYPHSTAVISEMATGRKWAVDSWYGATGAMPDIIPLEKWRGYGVFGRRYGNDRP